MVSIVRMSMRIWSSCEMSWRCFHLGTMCVWIYLSVFFCSFLFVETVVGSFLRCENPKAYNANAAFAHEPLIHRCNKRGRVPFWWLETPKRIQHKHNPAAYWMAIMISKSNASQTEWIYMLVRSLFCSILCQMLHLQMEIVVKMHAQKVTQHAVEHTAEQMHSLVSKDQPWRSFIHHFKVKAVVCLCVRHLPQHAFALDLRLSLFLFPTPLVSAFVHIFDSNKLWNRFRVHLREH